MFIAINYRFPATVSIAAKALPLAAGLFLSVIAANLVAPILLALVAAALGAVFALCTTVFVAVATVAAMIAHAVAYAATMALYAAVLAVAVRLVTLRRLVDWRLLWALSKGFALFGALVTCVVLAPFALAMIAPAAWGVAGVVAAGVGALKVI